MKGVWKLLFIDARLLQNGQESIGDATLNSTDRRGVNIRVSGISLLFVTIYLFIVFFTPYRFE